MRSSVAGLLLAVLLLCAPEPSHAWLVQSVNVHEWATGFTRLVPLRRIVTVATRFHWDGEDAADNAAQNGLVNNRKDTDCSILVADGSGHWVKTVLETPSLCVGGAIMVDEFEEAGVAIVLGLEGNQTTLMNVLNIGTDIPKMGNVVSLSLGKLPVAIDKGDPADPYLFIAMHDLGGATYQGGGTDPASAMKAVETFWNDYTNPRTLKDPAHNPQIIKVDPSTGGVGWLGLFETENVDGSLATTSSSTIATMIYTDFTLIVAGSTNGRGDAFGSPSEGAPSTDWDGYIAFINPVTGKVDTKFIEPQTSQIVDRGNIRISTQLGKNEYLNDMCLIGTNQLYVVGSTEGLVDGSIFVGGTFVFLIDVAKRKILTRRQLPGSNRSGLKIACGNEDVYVAGHDVFDQTVFDSDQSIFVMAFDSQLENERWAVKLDSTSFFGEKRRDQIVGIEVNPFDDVNVLFNSQNIFQGVSDVIMLDIAKDTGVNDLASSVSGKGGIPDGGINQDVPLGGPEGLGGSANAQTSNPIQNTTEDEDKNTTKILALSITIPITLALIVAMYAVTTEKRKRREPFMVAKAPITEEVHELSLQTEENNGADESSSANVGIV